MSFIDLHCDTASRIFYEKESLKKSSFSVDIDKLKKGGALAQVFAFFIDAGEVSNLESEFKSMYNTFIDEIEKNKSEIEIVRNINELKSCEEKGKIGAFLSIEEGEVLKGDIKNLKRVYDMGIRFITLTWNYKNSLGYPNYNYIYKDKGLTSLGKDMVLEMESLGIIPDCSHLSDGSFWDLIEICKKPFIATHSNSRKITPHPRNLTDDMIKALANTGGVMGLNFCADFLGKERVSSFEEITNHIKHIKNIGGIDVLALGSDFDGIENKVEIKDSSEMDKLAFYLHKEGFKESEIEKIFYKNVLRFMIENLR